MKPWALLGEVHTYLGDIPMLVPSSIRNVPKMLETSWELEAAGGNKLHAHLTKCSKNPISPPKKRHVMFVQMGTWDVYSKNYLSYMGPPNSHGRPQRRGTDQKPRFQEWGGTLDGRLLHGCICCIYIYINPGKKTHIDIWTLKTCGKIYIVYPWFMVLRYGKTS